MWGMWISFAQFSPKAVVEKKNQKTISHFGENWKQDTY